MRRRKPFWSIEAAIAIMIVICETAVCAPYPPAGEIALQGHYVPVSAGVHPFVFTSDWQANELLGSDTRIVRAALATFAVTMQTELKSAPAFEQAYSGCELHAYLQRFGYENGSASRSASDFALYWFLNSRHQGYGDERTASTALAAAKLILMNWASFGFRDSGRFLDEPKRYCATRGQGGNVDVSSDVGLQIGRGIPYLVQAYDILLASNVLSDADRTTIDAFLSDLYKLESAAMNERAASQHLDCNRYGNHTSVQIAALLALARIRDDGRAVASLARAPSPEVAIPWGLEVRMAIYGPGENVLNCFRNGQSQDFSQTSTAAAGEIVERYRAGEAQTFGYSMFSLDHLLLGAHILAESGFQPYSFQPMPGKSLLSALHYYSYYFANFLSDRRTPIPKESFNPYPNYQQYIGKLVSQGAQTISGQDRLLLPFLRSWRVYPTDPQITAVIMKTLEFDPSDAAFSKLDSLGIPALLPFTRH